MEAHNDSLLSSLAGVCPGQDMGSLGSITSSPCTDRGTEEASPEVQRPREIEFTEDNLVSVVTCACLFLFAATGNLTVFITLFRNRKRKSRVNLFILHLTVADMIVTFIMVPMEAAWHATVSWMAGDVACRFFMFCRTFGFYLSSWILVAISLDRYAAILHPLSISDAGKRAKIMLVFVWMLSTFSSVPQAVIFHVEEHPNYPWFNQCVTFNFFPTPSHELVYHLFNFLIVYGAPLVIIVIAYSLILREIHAKSRGTTTVMVFIMCWTPYFVMSAWFWADRKSARLVDPKIQRGLFLFAVSNSCVNPLVYGVFTINFNRELQRCCCCWQGDAGSMHNNSARMKLVRFGMNTSGATYRTRSLNLNMPAATGIEVVPCRRNGNDQTTQSSALSEGSEGRICLGK